MNDKFKVYVDPEVDKFTIREAIDYCENGYLRIIKGWAFTYVPLQMVKAKDLES